MNTEMCQHYVPGYRNIPIEHYFFKSHCAVGRFASLKCHSRRSDCNLYRPSYSTSQESPLDIPDCLGSTITTHHKFSGGKQ